jgi:hypothetical protein
MLNLGQVFGTAAEGLIAGNFSKLISKEVCEGIRKSFQGPLLEKYKELLTSVTESLKDDPFIKDKLKEVIGKIDVKEFKIKSSDPSLMIGGGWRGEGGLPVSNAEGLAAFTNGIGKTSMSDAMSMANGLSKVKGLASMGASEAKNLAGAATAGLSGITDSMKSLTAGLLPDEGVIPGYLSSVLNENLIKKMMTDGLDKLVQHITTDNPEEMTKMFIEVLKTQINAKFMEPDGSAEFKQIIISTIQEKCAAKQQYNEEEIKEILDEAPNSEQKDQVTTTSPDVITPDTLDGVSKTEETIKPVISTETTETSVNKDIPVEKIQKEVVVEETNKEGGEETNKEVVDKSEGGKSKKRTTTRKIKKH